MQLVGVPRRFQAEAAAAVSGRSATERGSNRPVVARRSVAGRPSPQVDRHEPISPARDDQTLTVSITSPTVGSHRPYPDRHLRHFVELALNAGARLPWIRRSPPRSAAHDRPRQPPRGAYQHAVASHVPRRGRRSWSSPSTTTPSGGNSSSSAPGHGRPGHPCIRRSSLVPALHAIAGWSRLHRRLLRSRDRTRPRGLAAETAGGASADGSTTSSPTAPTSRGTPTPGWHTATPRSRERRAAARPVPPELCAR